MSDYIGSAGRTRFEDDGLRDAAGDLAFFRRAEQRERGFLLRLVSLDQEGDENVRVGDALRTLNAASRLPRFGDSRERVWAVLDEALQRVERRAFRGDRDGGAADFPMQLCARLQVECFAHFFRDRRLSFAGASRGRLVRPVGFEPTTYSSGGCRSIQLSYGRPMEGSGLYISGRRGLG
jgi:hypothetical protein